MTSGAERRVAEAAALLRDAKDALEDALAKIADEPDPSLRGTVGGALRQTRMAWEAVVERRGEYAKRRIREEMKRERDAQTEVFPIRKATGGER